MPTPSAFP
ncbi:UNVERIFIED_CONTAM: hypothetical protein GTU68_013706 [Idotea baltica]|nr:hypothetical protein [Idotea baltica]